MEAWRERLVAEKAALDDKLEALNAYINSEASRALSEAERNRHRQQRYFMNGYSTVLQERIDAAEGE